jgi:hypothetical protein
MGWKYTSKSPSEALKIALFEAQQRCLREYQEQHGHPLPAEDHWGAIALFVAEQMPSIAWSSHVTTEALVDAMGQYIKDRSTREEARRERREKEVQQVHDTLLGRGERK